MFDVRKHISVVLAAALVLAFFPVSFERCIIEKNNPSLDNASLKAYADVTVQTDAASYIESAAEKSGLLPGDFVTTIGMISTAASGVCFAKDPGLKLGQSLEDSLSNLIDAADYPDYSTLSDEQKQSWGSAENYNAAKFNSLMSAFGLGSSVDGWYESGGGNFEWSQDALDRLNQIGSIGQNWVEGVGNTVGSVLSVLDPNSSETFSAYTGTVSYVDVDTTNIEDWPDELPDNVLVGYGDAFYWNTLRGSTYYQYCYATSAPVWYVIAYYNYNTSYTMYIRMISETGFMYGSFVGSSVNDPQQYKSKPATTNTVDTGTYSDNTFYYMDVEIQFASYDGIKYPTMPINGPYSQTIARRIALNGAKLVFTNGGLSTSNNEEIADYPEDIQSEENSPTIIYIPLSGITPGDSWQDYTTQPETDDPIIPDTGNEGIDSIIDLLERFTFYTTGQLKVHDEGVYSAVGDVYQILDEIKAILPTLANNDVPDAPEIIGDFDFPEFDQKATDLVETISSLAPFGALLLISEMTAILASTGHIDEPELEFDFDFFPDHSYTVTINLSWLDDAKPVINVVCIIMLVYSLAGATIRLIEMEAAS